MKNIVEAYIGVWVLTILLYLCLAFTSINMNVSQARDIANDIKTQIKASNGSILTENTYTYKSKDDGITLKNNGYSFDYTITKQSLYTDENGQNVYADISNDNSFKYNDIYKVELYYRYTVPIFGTQLYPIKTLVY